MPTASGMPFVPGSGGYNGSSMASPTAAAPTGTVAPPKPTATFISRAEKVETYGVQGTVFAVVVGVLSLLVLSLL